MDTILIVEDSKTDTMIIKGALADYTTITAGDGLEALDKLSAYPDIDMIILDLHMPNMNGFEFLQAMESKSQTIPIIVLTNFDEVDAQIHASKHDDVETSGYISSPVVRWFLDVLPKSMVLFLFRRILGNHKTVRKLSGTVFVTSVSMFSNIPGYAVPYAGGPNAVSFALGSTIKKPVVVNNAVEIREIMHISVSFNHDLVDGAPAARFLNRFRFYVEKSPQAVMEN